MLLLLLAGAGLGALLVRKEVLPLLRNKPFFGGGALEVVLPDQDFHCRQVQAAGSVEG